MSLEIIINISDGYGFLFVYVLKKRESFLERTQQDLREKES